MTNIIETADGVVEFADKGSGLPSLYFHGTFSGSEFALLMESSLLKDGYRVIIPHRPGFYGTPLDGRTSYADCADLGTLVLGHVGVDRVEVISTSAGGPSVLAFATRYPQRTVAATFSAIRRLNCWNGFWRFAPIHVGPPTG